MRFVSFVVNSLSASNGRKRRDHIPFFEGRVHIHSETVEDDDAFIIEGNIEAGDGVIDRCAFGDIQLDHAMFVPGRQGIAVVGDHFDADEHEEILAYSVEGW